METEKQNLLCFPKWKQKVFKEKKKPNFKSSFLEQICWEAEKWHEKQTEKFAC